MHGIKKSEMKQALLLDVYLDPTREFYLDMYASAIHAGYAERTARNIGCQLKTGTYEFLRNGLEEFRKKNLPGIKKEEAKLTPEVVLGILRECCDVAADPTRIDKWPKDYRHYFPTIMKAVELAGKYLKMFTDSQVNVGIQIITPEGKLPGEEDVVIEGGTV